MEVRRLRLLRELADRGTVTAVAKALDYTPSAVSQQLKALQSEAGVPLTEPAGRSLRLTDAGWALVARSDEVLAALERMDAELNSFRSAPRGTVRLAAFPSGALLVLPGLLSRLAEQPQLRVEFRDVDMQPSEVPALLADFDVLVAHRDDHAPPFDVARAEITPLYREPLDVALPPGHRLARKDRVELTELAAEPWIGVDVGFPVDDVLRSLAVRTGTRPRVVQRINDFRITEALVAAGHGVALLPRFVVDDPGLVLRPLAGVRAGRNVEAVTRRGATDRPAIRAVLEALRAECHERTT
ncbi:MULTISPECIES: LysR family transcriptional regulator [unclassified Saccharopolyspora]|uniref:LysR family transcriptional regulator n=1 Tax=unclassified Saccharopolyspora TaxID=2646250 RepID=UPI001CD19B33|nr:MULTISPECIES: LysR family transcriptional regulator [unclassified Saccharopolyspora]MCA1188367.1 LysR family transcriptional regulator [Saccharopolyspora sp. 6T]MCA1192052.1 LysR family transcriptional regulator [Saccharopolyspora sp. 6V]MCA1226080.1 LysR family transcriptional regulator [Saccharopolyspora sp. 6M]MCA1280214.1 LysR family transcriptional regulator [Saccharopolyspora sp. 7B]